MAQNTLESVEVEANSLTGDFEVGDEVMTLHFKRTVQGMIFNVDKRKKKVSFEGAEYPGGPTKSYTVDYESLALVDKAVKGDVL